MVFLEMCYQDFFEAFWYLLAYSLMARFFCHHSTFPTSCCFLGESKYGRKSWLCVHVNKNLYFYRLRCLSMAAQALVITFHLHSPELQPFTRTKFCD